MRNTFLLAPALVALLSCDTPPTFDVTRRGSLDLTSCPFITYLAMMDDSRVFVQATMGGGYSIVDVGNPTAPVWLEQNNSTLPASSVAFHNSTGFVAGTYYVRAVSFPRSQPHQVLDSFAFRAEKLAADGGVLYAAAADSLCVVDISNPAAMAVRSRVALGASGGKSGVSCLAADSGRLFLARWVTNSTNPRLYLLNVETPTAPAVLDSVVLDGTAWGEPAACQFKGDCVLYGNGYGLFTAQLTDSRNRLSVRDSTDIFAQFRGQHGGGSGYAAVTSIELTEDYAICACRCTVQTAVMDVANPRRPTLVYSTAEDEPPGGSVAGVAARGKFLYVAVESRALRVYELP